MEEGGARRLLRRIWKSTVEEEVGEELSFHVEMRARDNALLGMDPERARAEALRRFGSMDEVRAECRRIGGEREREMRRAEIWTELRQDGRYALRQLREGRGFTVIALLTLALGIGATTSIFSLLHAVVLAPLPFADPDRIVVVTESWRGSPGGGVSLGNFSEMQRANRTLVRMAAARYGSFNLVDEQNPDRVLGLSVTRDFFPVFGVPPLLGRTFLPDEDRPGAARVVVLSYSLYMRRFAGGSVLGRTIQLSGEPYTVVGVMPKPFDFAQGNEELWVPAAFSATDLANHDKHAFVVFGLLNPGVTVARANSDLNAIMTEVGKRFPETAERGAGVQLIKDSVVDSFDDRLWVLFGAVALVLLIACSNVANMLLARGASRAKELAIRCALGAGRFRIVRQLLTESAVLGFVGGALGVALAYFGVRALVSASPASVPRIERARVDAIALAFAVGASLLSSMVFGLAPAIRAARSDLQSTLREGGRAASLGGVKDRVRTTLVAAEIALAIMLLVGAGLLVRTAVFLGEVNPGFDPHGVLTARVTLPPDAYKEPRAAALAFAQMADALRRTPGVSAAGLTSQVPLGPGGNSNGLIREGLALAAENAVDARLRIVTSDYLRAIGIGLVRGRAFEERDVAGQPRVALVSQELARRIWPGQDPIGRRFACCEPGPDAQTPVFKTVVGVIADTHSRGLDQDAYPEFYLPIAQAPPETWEWLQGTMTLTARATNGNAASLAAAMRAAVHSVSPTAPLYDVMSMEERMSSSLATQRFNTLLLAGLSVLGLLLAAVGIYGIIAYFVSQRTSEFGLRIALGATARDILAVTARHSTTPVILGLSLGTGAALIGTRVLRGTLRGVAPNDPTTFIAVVLLLGAVAALATYIPARRAMRVDPATALRS